MEKKDLMLYHNDQFGDVRVIDRDGEPWFVAADVCRALEIRNSRDAMSRLDDDEKGVASTDTLGGMQEMSVVNEPGLYALVLGSRKPDAKAFKRWITHEVIPSIRKHGMYAMDNLLNNPELFFATVDKLREERQKRIMLEGKVTEQKERIAIQKQQIAEYEPKATYYDAVLASKDAVSVSVIAKDYGWNAAKLNKFLHAQGIQFKQGETWLLYEKYANLGYTKTRTFTYTKSDGEQGSNVLTKWTQKGRLFIYDLLKKNGYLPIMEME